jgi:hypothetical protein
MIEQEQLEKNVVDTKAASNAAYDTYAASYKLADSAAHANAVFLNAEAALIQDREAYYKSQVVLYKAQLKLKDYIKWAKQ